MKKEFAEALRIERNAWDDAHGHLGLSKERETLFQEYLKEVQAKRALFTKQDHLLHEMSKPACWRSAASAAGISPPT